MKTLAERLIWARSQKSLRDGNDFTQVDLATRAGVSQGAIGHLESGRTSTSRSITSIAKALEVDPVWLAEGKGDPFPVTWGAVPENVEKIGVVVAEEGDPDFYQIPKVQLQLSAGITGFQTVPEIHDGSKVSVAKNWVDRNKYRPSALIALTVKGESMEPNLYPGDLVIVNTAQVEMVDGMVYAVNYEGEAVIKRLSRDMGQWWLSSDNPDQRKYHRKSCRGGECIMIGRVVRRETDRI
ncbi:XRE family transcriptional regulator [Janthinobacterium sp. GMG2]|uniref:XRE family transcriptional regulator n=1 Tax=Janthinobacterium sp. GMG2 TaxID=3096606 RepID=UPI0029F587FC|nr:XRE family transcriptional regulator [Janthinobacterium sp. GMG2]MDX8121592.1 XRE family transcriptional regulator [Janthinobacterium sp. GMG2]